MDNNDSIARARKTVEQQTARHSAWRDASLEKWDGIPVGIPAEFQHLVDDCDNEIGGLFSASSKNEVIDLTALGHLTPGERAAFEQELLAEKIFGKGYTHLNAGFSQAVPSDVELGQMFRATAESVVRAAQHGDPEAVAFVDSATSDRNPTFVQGRKLAEQLCNLGEEFETDSKTLQFLRSFAMNDESSMRRVVREIVSAT